MRSGWRARDPVRGGQGRRDKVDPGAGNADFGAVSVDPARGRTCKGRRWQVSSEGDEVVLMENPAAGSKGHLPCALTAGDAGGRRRLTRVREEPESAGGRDRGGGGATALEIRRWGGAPALEGRKEVERSGGPVRCGGTAVTRREVGSR